MDKEFGVVIMSWDFANNGDVSVLNVGRFNNNCIDIINTFYGEEAYELYNVLIGKEEKEGVEV